MTADTVFEIFLYIMATGFSVAVIFYFLWAILHKRLSRQLDGLLFRTPFFQESELENYQHFPLSLVKSINYIYLIAYPKWAKKKRFRKLTQPVPVSKPMRIACKFHFSLGIFGLFLLIFTVIYVGGAVFMVT